MGSINVAPRAGHHARQPGIFPILRLCLIGLAALLALTQVNFAGAALLVKISANPASPRADETIIISVHTYYMLADGPRCMNAPGAKLYPFDVPGLSTVGIKVNHFEITATDPDQRKQMIYLYKSTDDPTVWQGRTMFPVPGKWALVMTLPWVQGGAPIPDPCGGSSILVDVLPAIGATPIATPQLSHSSDQFRSI